MLKKIIISFCFCVSINIYGQDLTIFFLKDGSILQGKIVNENQNRIFLKTDQGTIKIIPSDVLGREDTARKGDLTYFSDRLDQLNSNVRYLTGQVNHLKDSLSFSLEDLNNLFLNIEAIQNEFEIELLRLQSKTRQHNQNLEYNKDDLINNRAKISEHNQKIGGLSDTLRTLNNLVKKMNEKVVLTHKGKAKHKEKKKTDEIPKTARVGDLSVLTTPGHLHNSLQPSGRSRRDP